MDKKFQNDAIQFEKENGSIDLIKAGFSSLCHLLVDKKIVAEIDLVTYFQKEIKQVSNDLGVMVNTKFVVPDKSFLREFLFGVANIEITDMNIKISQFVEQNPHSGEREFLVVFNTSKKNIKLIEECYRKLLASRIDQSLNGC